MKKMYTHIDSSEPWRKQYLETIKKEYKCERLGPPFGSKFQERLYIYYKSKGKIILSIEEQEGYEFVEPQVFAEEMAKKSKKKRTNNG